jgi:hypothetical protein
MATSSLLGHQIINRRYSLIVVAQSSGQNNLLDVIAGLAAPQLGAHASAGVRAVT